MKIFEKIKIKNGKEYKIFNISFFKKKTENGKRIFFLFNRKIFPKTDLNKNKLKSIYTKIFNYNKKYFSKDKIAVFIPDSMAIAEFTTKIHTIAPNDFDMFVDVKNMLNFNKLKNLNNKQNKNIIPYQAYSYFAKYFNYYAKIFVLGGSPHHINALNEAIKTKNEKNRFLLIHDGILIDLIIAYFKNKNFEDCIREFYPEKINLLESFDKQDIYAFCRDNNMVFIKPIIKMTGINHIIALNDRVKELILADLDDEERKNIKIDVIYLPFEKFNYSRKIKISKNKDDFIIGTFGIQSKIRQTKEIIEAVNMLNDNNIKTKLLIAGYSVKDYVNSLNLDLKNVIMFEKPTAKKWLALLNSVDLAIQLKSNSFSNSSGPVSELVGLKKELILTENFVPKDIEEFFYFVPNNVSTQELYSLIVKIITQKNKKMINNEIIFEKYGFNALSNKIKEIVINNLGEKDE